MVHVSAKQLLHASEKKGIPKVVEQHLHLNIIKKIYFGVYDNITGTLT